MKRKYNFHVPPWASQETVEGGFFITSTGNRYTSNVTFFGKMFSYSPGSVLDISHFAYPTYSLSSALFDSDNFALVRLIDKEYYELFVSSKEDNFKFHEKSTEKNLYRSLTIASQKHIESNKFLQNLLSWDNKGIISEPLLFFGKEIPVVNYTYPSFEVHTISYELKTDSFFIDITKTFGHNTAGELYSAIKVSVYTEDKKQIIYHSKNVSDLKDAENECYKDATKYLATIGFTRFVIESKLGKEV